jgi:hypothetical protein
MRCRIAVLIVFACAGIAVGSRLDPFPSENPALPDSFRPAETVCKTEPGAHEFDPCLQDTDRGCIKLTRFSIAGYYLPVLDTTERRRRWCETPPDDLPWMWPPFFAVVGPVPVISPAASEDRRAVDFCDTRPHCKAEAPTPEVPSFLLVGAGLLLLRFPLRRRG